MDISDTIRSLRKERRLTQEQLAEACNVTSATISRIESNQQFPRPDTLKKIADYLGISVGEIMDNSYVAPINEKILDEIEHEYKCRCRTVNDMREYDAPLELINYAQGFRDGIAKTYEIIIKGKE